MPFEPGNQEARKANHKRPRIITQKLIAKLQDSDGAALDRVISALISKAEEGDVPAIKEVLDRVEGKVPQAVIGGDEDEPSISVIHTIRRIIVDPRHSDSEGVPAASDASKV
jgi:hypothetical protein